MHKSLGASVWTAAHLCSRHPLECPCHCAAVQASVDQGDFDLAAHCHRGVSVGVRPIPNQFYSPFSLTQYQWHRLINLNLFRAAQNKEPRLGQGGPAAQWDATNCQRCPVSARCCCSSSFRWCCAIALARHEPIAALVWRPAAAHSHRGKRIVRSTESVWWSWYRYSVWLAAYSLAL